MFVPSVDNVVSVKNHHVLFVLILFPCAWDVLGVISAASCRSCTGQRTSICWVYKEGVDCSCNEQLLLCDDGLDNKRLSLLLLLWIRFVPSNRMFRNKYRAAVSFRQC